MTPLPTTTRTTVGSLTVAVEVTRAVTTDAWHGTWVIMDGHHLVGSGAITASSEAGAAQVATQEGEGIARGVQDALTRAFNRGQFQ